MRPLVRKRPLDGRFRAAQERLAGHARPRRWLVALAVLAALLASIARPSPAARSVEAVAAMLGAAAGGAVRPDDFVWEQRGGWLSDTLLGRRVVFLASRLAGRDRAPEPADVYRARVRLSRDGRPIEVRALRRLTSTELADERDLVARGRHVAFATVAGGKVQGVTVLDLAGDYPVRQARTALERLACSLGAWLDTGDFAGARRTEVTFEAPPAVARIDLTDAELVLALGPEGVPAAVDLASGASNTGPSNTFGLVVRTLPRRPAPAAELGPALASAVGGALPAAVVTTGVRAGFAVADALAPRGARPAPMPPSASAMAAAAPGDGWPPAPLAAPHGGAGEGVWADALPPFAPPPLGLADGAPPAVVETFVHPDPADPVALVRLVAFDARQFELGLEAGSERPRPSASLHGLGAVPEADRPRTIAVFAADRPSPDEACGTVVRGRAVVPPRDGAGSIALGRDAVSFGAWRFGAELPPFVRSLWQAGGPPLLGPGAPPVDGLDRRPAPRAALAHARAGHLVYAYGDRLSAGAIARALELAACDVAYELTGDRGRPALAFLGFPPGAAEPFGVLLDDAMRIAPADLALRSAVPTFHVARRDPRPDLPLPDGATWAPDAGRQPPPAWLPAVHASTLTTAGAQVHLTTFAPGRFRWRIRAGARELVSRLGAPFVSTLADDEAAHLGVAIGLGNGRATKRRPPRGLATAGSVGLALRPEAGVLLAEGPVLMVLHSEDAKSLGPEADAAEVPLTAEEGRLRPEARELGGMRSRVALCVLPDGTALTAASTFDSDEATTSALVDRGCTRVVALDRGAHQASFVHRAGTPGAPLPRYDVTTLFGVEQVAAGRVVAMP